MEYADLAILDLSKFATPEGRAELAILARDAMRTQGFFYVINHGLTREEVQNCLLVSDLHQRRSVLYHQKDRVFDIGDVPFSQVPDEEKKRYAGKMLETGSYQGYKLRQYWVRFVWLVDCSSRLTEA